MMGTRKVISIILSLRCRNYSTKVRSHEKLMKVSVTVKKVFVFLEFVDEMIVDWIRTSKTTIRNEL
jgi:hypothetical protein